MLRNHPPFKCTPRPIDSLSPTLSLSLSRPPPYLAFKLARFFFFTHFAATSFSTDFPETIKCLAEIAYERED
jgi:hypothetical protein